MSAGASWAGASGKVLSVVFVLVSPRAAEALDALSALQIAPNASYTATRPARRVRTIKEMVEEMRAGGMPVSLIAEFSGVERKTVYAWLNGANVRQENAMRVESVYSLLSSTGFDYRSLHRLISRRLSTGATLRDLLSAGVLDARAILGACEELRPALERHATQRLAPEPPSGRNAAIDEIPHADLG